MQMANKEQVNQREPGEWDKGRHVCVCGPRGRKGKRCRVAINNLDDEGNRKIRGFGIRESKHVPAPRALYLLRRYRERRGARFLFWRRRFIGCAEIGAKLSEVMSGGGEKKAPQWLWAGVHGINRLGFLIHQEASYSSILMLPLLDLMWRRSLHACQLLCISPHLPCHTCHLEYTVGAHIIHRHSGHTHLSLPELNFLRGAATSLEF